MTQESFFGVSIYYNLKMFFFFCKLYIPHIHGSIVHGGQDMETTIVPFDKWLDKEDLVHIYNEILLSYKKRWTTDLATALIDL